MLLVGEPVTAVDLWTWSPMAVLRRGGTPASPCRRGTSTRLAGKPGNRPDRASVLARATSWSPRTVVSIPQCLVRLSGKRARRLKEQDIDEALRRSEEHTSELQSLMRISYAVFCLK